jgi:hypothetical protein
MCEVVTTIFVFRLHKAVTDELQCRDYDDIDIYYFLVLRRRNKTIATITAAYRDRAQCDYGKSATSTCLHDVWNIDMELARTRFHGSTIFV